VFYWIYEIPSLLAIAAFGIAFAGICWLGIFVTRPLVRNWFHRHPGMNPILGDYLQYFGIIYGLLLGLLAIGTYQNHADAEKAVSREASALAGLYRDVSAYPEPYRTDLRTLVRDYTRSTIEEDWPLQRQGIFPSSPLASPVAAIHTRMVQFEPQTMGQAAVHQTALGQFTTFLEDRRSRLYSVTSRMPAIMWYTVGLGALINMIFLWLWDIRLGPHLLLAGLISFFTATMICLIAILDNPFRGDVGVSPEAFELIYNQIILKY
jgi:Protein of unknown function (DUF4239)